MNRQFNIAVKIMKIVLQLSDDLLHTLPTEIQFWITFPDISVDNPT